MKASCLICAKVSFDKLDLILGPDGNSKAWTVLDVLLHSGGRTCVVASPIESTSNSKICLIWSSKAQCREKFQLAKKNFRIRRTSRLGGQILWGLVHLVAALKLLALLCLVSTSSILKNCFRVPLWAPAASNTSLRAYPEKMELYHSSALHKLMFFLPHGILVIWLFTV